MDGRTIGRDASTSAGGAAAAAVLVAAALAACDTGPVDPPGTNADVCDGTTPILTTEVVASGVLSAEGGPWAVPAGARVFIADVLEVEAGVKVCLERDATLALSEGGALVVRGTPERPVVFTATDPAAPWGGIHMAVEADSVRMSHAVVEHAATGLSATNRDRFGTMGGRSDVEIDHVRFRRIQWPALQVTAARVRSSVVDTACISCDPGRAAVEVLERGDSLSLEDVVIRGSGGRGIFAEYPARLSLVDVTVQGARGVGIVVGRPSGAYAGASLVQAEGVVVRDGASHAYDGPLRGGALLTAGEDARERIRGNASDTIVADVATPRSTATIGADFPWRIGYAPVPGDPEAKLDLRAGADVTLSGQFGVLAEGSAGEPIRITGGLVRPWSPDDGPGVLRHARLRNVAVASGPWGDTDEADTLQTMLLEDVELEGGALVIGTVDAQLTRVTVRGAQPLDGVEREVLPPLLGEQAAIIVAPRGAGARLAEVEVVGGALPGLLVAAPDVTLTACTVRENAGHGVLLVGEGSATLRACVFEDNDGAGVANLGTGEADARLNWWGDPAGPDGPDGDGVEGVVDASEPLSEPPARPAMSPPGAG